MTSENDGFAPGSQASEDRRKFLATCGKFAAVTPPAITMLLSTSLNSTVVAQSAGHSNRGGPRGNNGFGNGGGDGTPNGKEDNDR
ncbi:hypothetical protein V1291_003549 [Nitrobacteraceae bacterium AZCC 1564]